MTTERVSLSSDKGSAARHPLFIIPARGGSKGIPHKNIVDLGGRPLIAYSIDAAKGALRSLGIPGELHRIIVSTDSPEIADVARAEGIDVPFLRPDSLSTDTAGSREVILHAMDYADRAGIPYDGVVLLQPTSPFRTWEHVVGALELFSPDIDMVVGVKPAVSNPYYNCFEQDEVTGFLHISKGDGLYTRRQDAPDAWEYNGAIYIITPDSIRQMPLGAFPRRRPYIMSTEDSVDIDTPLDLTLARAIMVESAGNSAEKSSGRGAGKNL